MKKVFVFGLIIITALLLTVTVNAKSTGVGAVVKMLQLDFTVYPEKRDPVIGNWSTILQLDFKDCASLNPFFSYEGITTSDSGTGTLIIPDEDIIEKGNYAISIKGFSHLTKNFSCRYIADNLYESEDFTPEGDLLAGDTSNVVDDYINSLDLSTTTRNIYQNSYKDDLNQDTTVNSIDLSNQVWNLFLAGDE